MNETANPLRGETQFLIHGRQRILRPSFEALVAAETEIGSLFAIVERASEGALTLTEMTALIWHCIPANDRPEREAVGQAILSIGLIDATKPVRAILSQALKGQSTA